MEIAKDQTEIILDSIADGVFTVDSDWHITSFNRAAETITGINKGEAIGRHCWDVFKASICENCCILRQTMESGDSIVNQSIYILNSEGERVPISVSTALLRDRKGQVVGGVETFRDLSVVEALRKELEGSHTFMDIISKNEEMRRLFAILERVAEGDSTVLLTGESGTGKELFAKAIHSLSARKGRRMVTVNCGALPDTLLQSELFGYKAGAFTDAKKDKPGRLRLAEGGTLFLDEVGDISPALQVGLLRVLQDKVYEPLGGTRPEKADVRIVTATNRDLEELVREGKFRQDLYYRVNVVRLALPPLRKRKEDIPLLADHFIRKFNRLRNKEIQGLSPDVMPVLMSHDFPGNIRELENVIEYAIVVCQNSILGTEHLPDYLRPKETNLIKAISQETLKGSGSTWEDMEKQMLCEMLKRNHWNRRETANQMGVHPTTLWRKMKKLGVHLPRSLTTA